MKTKTLWILWGCLWGLTALLGFIPSPAGLGKALLVLLALGFFVPPCLLLYRGDRKTAVTIRTLSLIWLGLTTVLLVLNLLSIQATRVVGDVLYSILVVFTAPMICGQYWLAVVFLWACLLFAAISRAKMLKRTEGKENRTNNSKD